MLLARGGLHPLHGDRRFNGHPPLGVNATFADEAPKGAEVAQGGFNGHPPLGVNATGYPSDNAWS